MGPRGLRVGVVLTCIPFPWGEMGLVGVDGPGRVTDTTVYWLAPGLLPLPATTGLPPRLLLGEIAPIGMGDRTTGGVLTGEEGILGDTNADAAWAQALGWRGMGPASAS